MDWFDELLLLMWDVLESMRDDPPKRGPPKDKWEHTQ